jgi:chemotaxis protein CheC
VTVPWTLTELQRDALRELANVGAGHAATALSVLLSGQRLSFQAPEAWGWTAEAWSARLEPEVPWVAGVLDVEGDVHGALWLLFSKPGSEALAAQLFSDLPVDAPGVDRAVKRAAQAMGASALSAMGKLTGLAFASGQVVLRQSAHAAPPGNEAPRLVLDVHLRAPSFAVQFLLLPEAASVGALLRSLRV